MHYAFLEPNYIVKMVGFVHDTQAVREQFGVNEEQIRNIRPLIRKSYDSSDIFNADKTGLFYKLTPDKTLKFVGETCSGGKLSKDRITVLVAANMSSTEKRKLLVIGKSKNLSCFKNKHLLIKYRSNSRAWMTSELFTEELREWNEKKDSASCAQLSGSS